MPRVAALERQRFSAAGPLPQVLSVGAGLAVMLLCLQGEQLLEAPEGDGAETLFCVLAGEGVIREGEAEHRVAAGDVVHALPGERKALRAEGSPMTVLGVRRLERRA